MCWLHILVSHCARHETSIVFAQASSAMVNFLYWSSILSRDLEEMWLAVAAGIQMHSFSMNVLDRIMWIYNAPNFFDSFLCFYWAAGQYERWRSPDLPGVRCPPCWMSLSWRSSNLPGRRKPPCQNFQKFDLEVLVWWSSSLSMRTRIPKKRLEVVCPPENTVITNDDTCRNSEGGKRHPRRDVFVEWNQKMLDHSLAGLCGGII